MTRGMGSSGVDGADVGRRDSIALRGQPIPERRLTIACDAVTAEPTTMPAVTPLELREMSRRLRDAARAITDITLKRQIAETALTLAELAEALQRQGEGR
jgi:hypothetical protein